jgi:hypothetical protein
MGYGLIDVTHEGCQLTDPRINANSFLLDRSRERTAEVGYGEWLAERYPFDPKAADIDHEILEAEMERQMLEGRADDAYETVAWQGEYGLPNVLVVRPAGSPEWHRYNSPIDYEEEAIRGLFTDYRVERIVGGIHPYEGIYMDARTGEQIIGEQADRVRGWRRIINARRKVSGADRADLLNRVARAMGFKDHAEAERYVVPLVPGEIRRLCEWGELFTWPDVWMQLRPVLYTYYA